MSRRDVDRLDDITAAIAAIASHLRHGGLDEDLVFDAVRMRLLEVGEAVKALPSPLIASEPGIPWRSVAALRDRLAHRYFDTDRGIVEDTVRHDLDELGAAVLRMRQRAEADGSTADG